MPAAPPLFHACLPAAREVAEGEADYAEAMFELANAASVGFRTVGGQLLAVRQDRDAQVHMHGARSHRRVRKKGTDSLRESSIKPYISDH
jgi:hypothetical protein